MVVLLLTLFQVLSQSHPNLSLAFTLGDPPNSLTFGEQPHKLRSQIAQLVFL